MTSKVLVIGSGSREHALTWKLSQSSKVSNIFVCPGNGGTQNENKTTNVDLPLSNYDVLTDWCKALPIDLVVVGPEVPLADGISDAFNAQGILCFGPTKKAAEIEASKYFAKSFMNRHDIPTARWKGFTDPDEAIEFINTTDFNGLVVKASGLAAGKGVIVTTSKDEAIVAVQEMIELRKFGDAGSTILIEEKLEGKEVSVMAICDGKHFLTLPAAQDFKRAYDDDKGPNTGGMGAYAPVSDISKEEMDYIEKYVIEATVEGLRNEGRPFLGVLYSGLMMTNAGPKVLEFNCRFGDPETQVVLPLIKADLFNLFVDCCKQNLLPYSKNDFIINQSVVTVTLASGGYPGSYKKGTTIHGLDIVKNIPNVHIFQAGTKFNGDELLTNGGRVLSVTAIGNSIQDARLKSYHALSSIKFDDMTYRNDIAKQASWKLVNGRHETTSYCDSGVNIETAASFVELIRTLTKGTHRSGCLSNIGSFGSLFDLKAAWYDDPILVAGTDGVGTKLKTDKKECTPTAIPSISQHPEQPALIQSSAETRTKQNERNEIANDCNNHSTIGIDLVAMCVNDILAHGAEPLFFLDYYACGKLDVKAGKSIVEGIVEGCKRAGCALVGGETAEMPGMYHDKDYDLAGFAVGAVARHAVLPNVSSIQASDIVIGLPSSGIHSNGFSLVRKIVEDCGYTYSGQCPYTDDHVTLGESLLTPTKIYVYSVLPLMKQGKIKAFAHITGGGLKENIPRVLPSNISCILDAHSWIIPDVFGWLAYEGNVTSDEMFKVFNCGIGAVLIVDRKDSEFVLNHFQMDGENAKVIGILKNVEEGCPQVEVKGFSTELELLSRKLSSPYKKLKKDKMKVGVLISGSGTNLQALIDHCKKKKSSAEIVVVISNVENVYGLQRAANAHILVKVINHKKYKSRLEFDMAVLAELKSCGVELVCLAGFMRILTGEFVREWAGRLINIHPSLLPAFKGANAHEQALKAGVKITGCTAHFVVEEIDAGGIIAQEAVPVFPGDTEESLQERVKLKEWEVFPLAMELVAKGKVKEINGEAVFL